jgi:hypothetical protein
MCGKTAINTLTNPATTATTPTTATSTSQGTTLINAAGAAYTGRDGRVWRADFGFVDGRTTDRGNIAIAGTLDDRLYQTERWDLTKYDIPLANGAYDVTLHFAETSGTVTGRGDRVFSVNLENGQGTLNNLDVFAEVGKNTQLPKRFPGVQVRDGKLTIDFTRGVNRTFVNAIEITRVATVSTQSATTSSVISSGVANQLAGVRIETADTVSVRTSQGALLGTQPARALGVVQSNPSVTIGGIRYVFVDFATGTDGYVATEFITTTTKARSGIDSLLMIYEKLY